MQQAITYDADSHMTVEAKEAHKIFCQRIIHAASLMHAVALQVSWIGRHEAVYPQWCCTSCRLHHRALFSVMCSLNGAALKRQTVRVQTLLPPASQCHTRGASRRTYAWIGTSATSCGTRT